MNKQAKTKYLKDEINRIDRMFRVYSPPDELYPETPAEKKAQAVIDKNEKIVERARDARRRKWKAVCGKLKKGIAPVRRAMLFEEPESALKKLDALVKKYGKYINA